MVVFDPPHLRTLGETSWMAKKYGKLPKDWQSLIHVCFEYMQRCVTREYRYVESIEEAIDWMNRFMNNGG